MKAFADGIMIVCIYGKDFESNGVLYGSALRELQVGLILLHIIMFNYSYWSEKYFLTWLNAAMVMFSIILNYLLRKNKTSTLLSTVKSLRGFTVGTTTPMDKSQWINNFCHPVLKKLPDFPDVIQEASLTGGGGGKTKPWSELVQENLHEKPPCKINLDDILANSRTPQKKEGPQFMSYSERNIKDRLIEDWEEGPFHHHSMSDPYQSDYESEDDGNKSKGTPLLKYHLSFKDEDDFEAGLKPVPFASFSPPSPTQLSVNPYNPKKQSPKKVVSTDKLDDKTKENLQQPSSNGNSPKK